jgi:hypothetical protein
VGPSVIAVGLVGLVCALLCGVGFVSATVRADARLREEDPARTSGFTGAPACWAVVGIAFVVASLGFLAAGVLAP